jgi:hypothetical protein
MRLGWLQSKDKSLSPTENQTLAVQSVPIPTELFQIVGIMHMLFICTNLHLSILGKVSCTNSCCWVSLLKRFLHVRTMRIENHISCWSLGDIWRYISLPVCVGYGFMCLYRSYIWQKEHISCLKIEKCPTFPQSLLCRIQMISPKQFIGFMEESVYSLMYTGL